MPLSAKQQEIASCQTRFRVVVAGRRGGKAHLAMRELARYASQPNSVVWYLTGSRQQAKSLVWNKLKKKLQGLNWVANTNESELRIELVNGSQICTCKSNEPSGEWRTGE